MPYLYGFRFRSIEWLGPNAIQVEIDPGAYALDGSGVPVEPRWQLYAGRDLISWSESSAPTIVAGIGSGAASPLSVIVCEADEAAEDFGHLLHRKPWDVYQITWPAVADSDCQVYEIVASRNPGEAYDTTNVLARVPHTGASSYSFTLPPFPDRGDWSIAVIARDNALGVGLPTPTNGNAGTPRAAVIAALVYPVDFVLGGASTIDASDPLADYSDFRLPLEGERFAAAIVEPGVLDVSFEYGTPREYP